MTKIVSMMEGIAALVQERGETYGHPAEFFARLDQMAEPIKDCADKDLRHVLYMIAFKICRLIANPTHVDSWRDISGYCMVAAMIMDKRNG